MKTEDKKLNQWNAPTLESDSVLCVVCQPCEWCTYGRSVGMLAGADVACSKHKIVMRASDTCDLFTRLSQSDICL